MKTDPRAYSWTLTEELAETAGTQGLDAHDLYIYVCGLQKAKGDPGLPDNCSEDFVELVDPDYITRWAQNNVIYRNGGPGSKTVKNYNHLRYHGKYMTAKELSELTGIRQNTIYVYWAKVNKDPTAFDLKIDRRLSRYGKAEPDEVIDDTWEVAEES